MAKLDILITATNNTSGPVAAARRALEGLGSAAGAVAIAAGAAAAAAVAGVTAAVVTGVSKAADLEQGVADIAAVMGVAFEETQPLKDLITSLGLDPTLKVSATEASDAIMQLAQSGMSMSEILDGAARSTVLLSNATGGDMATSAAIASDAMSLFGIQADDMARAVNGITGVTVASKFGIQDYQLALSQAGGVAAAVGVSFDDFNTTIAAISPYFASGSDAGTSYKVMLQRLIPASEPAAAAMRELGLITEEGGNQFFDASGNMRSMSEIAGILQGAFSGLSEEQKNNALSTIFGTDAMRAAVALAEAGTPAFDAMAGSIAGIDAEQLAATRMDTLSGAMEILGGVVDSVSTQVGDAFLPAVRQMTDWAIAFATEQGPGVVAWFDGLAQAITATLPALLGWAQMVVLAMGEVLNWLSGGDEQFENLRATWGAVTEIVGGVIDATIQYVRDHWQDWVAILLSWGQLFAEWGATLWGTYLAPGLLAFWGEMASWILDPQKRQMLVEGLMAWWDIFATWAGNLWAGTLAPAFAGIAGSLAAWLDDNAFGIATKIGEWLKPFTDFTANLIASWNEAWPEIARIVGETVGEIGEDLERLLDALTRIFGWFSGGEGEAAASSWATFFTRLVDVASVPLAGLVHVIANIVEMVAMLGDLFGALREADWGNAGDIAREIAGRFGDTVWTALGIPAGIWDAIQGRAAGGPVQADQPYWVGEEGPELFMPNRSGAIMPAGSQYNQQRTWNVNVNLTGSSSAANDVQAALRLVGAMYG